MPIIDYVVSEESNIPYFSPDGKSLQLWSNGDKVTLKGGQKPHRFLIRYVKGSIFDIGFMPQLELPPTLIILMDPKDRYTLNLYEYQPPFDGDWNAEITDRGELTCLCGPIPKDVKDAMAVLCQYIGTIDMVCGGNNAG